MEPVRILLGVLAVLGPAVGFFITQFTKKEVKQGKTWLLIAECIAALAIAFFSWSTQRNWAIALLILQAIQVWSNKFTLASIPIGALAGSPLAFVHGVISGSRNPQWLLQSVLVLIGVVIVSLL